MATLRVRSFLCFNHIFAAHHNSTQTTELWLRVSYSQMRWWDEEEILSTLYQRALSSCYYLCTSHNSGFRLLSFATVFYPKSEKFFTSTEYCRNDIRYQTITRAFWFPSLREPNSSSLRIPSKNPREKKGLHVLFPPGFSSLEFFVTSSWGQKLSNFLIDSEMMTDLGEDFSYSIWSFITYRSPKGKIFSKHQKHFFQRPFQRGFRFTHFSPTYSVSCLWVVSTVHVFPSSSCISHLTIHQMF